jgi:hypothetical protein
MKKIFILTILLSVFTFYACDKGDNLSDKEEATTYKVQVSIDNLRQSAEAVSENEVQPYERIKYLNYAIFDKNGNQDLIKEYSLILNNNKPNIKLDLSAGEYILAMVGSDQENVKMSNYYNNYKGLSISGGSFTSENVYYDAINITVSDKPLLEQINLKRIVGKIEIIINDATNIPSNTLTMYPTLMSTTLLSNWYIVYPSSLYMSDYPQQYITEGSTILQTGGLSDEQENEICIKKEDFNQMNPISLYCLPTNVIANNNISSVDLYIQLSTSGKLKNIVSPFDTSMRLIASGVKVQSNKILRYTGSLRGGKNGDFNLVINDNWDGITETEMD